MKRLKAIVMASMLAITCSAQSVKSTNNSDSTIFKGYLYNKEYDVYIQMDFYHNNIVVPYQEIYGEMPGYFGDKRDGRKWLFTNATIKNKHTAIIQITNDYGSEDLTATLRQVNDSTFQLHQDKGSTLKIARNRKWVKMPTSMTFVKGER